MNLTGIIAISGRPGLFKVVAQGKNNVIVESLVDRKRFPAYTSDRISALDDISVYTYSEEKPLKEILKSIFEKENGSEVISHKEKDGVLISYMLEILPNYDQERVYVSDIKKVFQWYNLLHKAGELKLSEDKTVTEKVNEISEDENDSEVEVKTKTKKAVSAKTTSEVPKGVKAKKVVPKGKDDKTLNTKTMSTQNNI
jgi:hypothetical protein